MDMTRRKIIQLIAATSAAAGVSVSLPSNTGAVTSSTIAGPHLVEPTT